MAKKTKQPSRQKFKAGNYEEEELRGVDTAKPEFKCKRCHRWRSFDNGHSEGDECSFCEDFIYKKIVKFVRLSHYGYRNEHVILTHVLGRGHWGDNEPTFSISRIEDMLFELVLSKKLWWFGEGQHRNKFGELEENYLKYRIPTRKDLKNATSATHLVRVHRARPDHGAASAR